MIDRLKENWDAIKDTLKENYDISKVSYDTWIVPMEIHNVDNDQVYILADTKGIPNILDYIKKKYKQILEIVIEEKIGLHCNVIFVTSEDLAVQADPHCRSFKHCNPRVKLLLCCCDECQLKPTLYI